MFEATIEQIAASCSGSIISHDCKKKIMGVSIDSRNLAKDNAFVAIKGENFDGHDFVNQAILKEIGVIIVNSTFSIKESWIEETSFVVVENTLTALQDLARFWRKQLSAWVIGLTGSNGKTTTKDFAYTLIKDFKKTQVNPGNFNNHFGLPLSLLNVKKNTEVYIQELGMNHRGEIAELCKLLEPDVTLVTNVGTSHIGELGSQDEIAKAKNEIYQEAPNSLKIFNLDNSFTKKMFENYKSQSKCVTFSKTKKANVMLDAEVISLIKYQINGFINDSKISSPFYVLGLQNIENLMAALCIGYSCGLSATQLEDKINLCRTSWGRNQLVSLKSGAIVIFDGYNANLESMSALFETIKRDSKSKKGKIILFLGEIFEQGEFAEQSHFQLGQMAAKVNADDTFFVGENYIAFGRGYESISIRKKPILSNAYKESLAFQLKTMLKPDDVVLIKASRGMNFERVVNALDPIDF